MAFVDVRCHCVPLPIVGIDNGQRGPDYRAKREVERW
jgi:hypothetical protein